MTEFRIDGRIPLDECCYTIVDSLLHIYEITIYLPIRQGRYKTLEYKYEKMYVLDKDYSAELICKLAYDQMMDIIDRIFNENNPWRSYFITGFKFENDCAYILLHDHCGNSY